MFSWLQRLVAGPEYEPLRASAYPQPMFVPAPPPVANLELRAESRDACFPFEVQLDVHYALRNGGSVADPLLIAQAGIGRRAREVAARHRLTEAEQLRGELQVALARRIEIETTGVVAWASCLAVGADQRFVEAIRRYEALHRQELTRVWYREAEEAEIKYLGQMLDDPRRATAWWFQKNPDEVQRLPDIAQTFTTLRSALEEADTTSIDGDSWNKLFEEFHAVADTPARYLLGYQISQILGAHGLKDLADRARLLNGDAPTA